MSDITRPTLVLAALGLLSWGACAPQSHDQKVAALRSQYTAELTSFSVVDAPQPAADTAAEAAAAEPASGDAGAPASADETAAPAPAPTRTSVVLDILVSTESRETLPGLTVELEQVDSSGKVKSERHLWLDTSSVILGSAGQITQTVDDVDYQEGDAFAVSIRNSVPAEERGDYREFQAAGADSGS